MGPVARSTFDEAYYRRFYQDAPVHDAAAIGHLCQGVLGLCGWWGIPIHSVLDVGAGTGLWRDWFARHRPDVRYRSIDLSEHACATYGHERRDISRWRPPPADLVVCQGVLHYLDDDAAERAIEHLAAATAAVLYLEAPTLGDRRSVIDRDVTDMDVHWRPGRWYRQRLEPHFVDVGAGLLVARRAGLSFYELERHGRP
jgi:hypothetical protein